MRTLFSAFAGIAAVVLFCVAVPALWLDQHVVQEEGFIELAAPLGSDPQFQSQLVDATADTVIADADFAPGLAELVRPLVEGAAESLTDHPEYQEAWNETLRLSHELTFTTEAQPPEAQGGGAITLDIAPLVTLVTEDAAQAIGTDIPVPPQVLVGIGQSDQGQAIQFIENYAGLAVPFAAASGLAFVLAIAIARRRSTTLLLIGFGVALSAGLWKLGTEFAVRQVSASSDENALAGLFKDYFVSTAEASFNAWIIAGAGAGIIMMLLGLIARIFAGSRT